MSESGSSHGGGSSFGGSVASSMHNEEGAMQQDRDDNEDDLLEENHGFMESAFAVMHGFNKGRGAESKKIAVFRVAIEFLFMFAMAFNTTFSAWNIDGDLWIYKAYSWLLIRLLVLPKGYATYIAVFYLISAIVLGLIFGTYLISYLCKKAEESGAAWVKRVTSVLQLGSMVAFSMAWVSVLDYFVFMLDCHWSQWQTGPHHVFFPEQNCLAMPHLAHMAFAVIMTIIFLATMLGMAVSGCELNPLTPNYLASPLPSTMLKAMFLKACIVIICSCLDDFQTLQPVLMFICAALIVITMFRTTIFYNPWVLHAKAGLWSGILLTSALLIAATRDGVTEEQATHYTWSVLYGIFPVVLGVMGLSAIRLRIIQRPLIQLRAAHLNPASMSRLRDVYRFSSVEQVEFLTRVMRVWNEDHEADPDAMDFGEFILKVGMARFPGDPSLLLMHCNMLIEGRKDAQAARTQLQLAIKSTPNLLYRYFIYVTQELAKTLRHDGGTLDLVSYVEFQRNYRACVRAHKLALQSQRAVWHILLSDTVDFKQLQRALDGMTAAEATASTIYRRVLERYPENGKLLKIYGRFVEFVRNDPRAAAKAYADATKLGITDSFLSLVSGDGIGSEAGRAAIGTINEKADGVVIINATGTIMMVNHGCLKMFGYDKGELDNKNVSLLMPQPFSSRHNTFLSNYLSTGQARIMDIEQSIVALHKDRSVFPISLVVTHLSGQGQESMFMGVLRPRPVADTALVQVWATPGGTILCTDQLFRDWFGRTGGSVAGQPFSSLGVDTQALDKFMIAANTLPPHQVTNGALSLRTKLLHKYMAPIDVELTVSFAGTVDNRILVLSIRCLTDSVCLMVLNQTGKVSFTTNSLTTMLGVNLEGRMVQTVVPEPYGNLHLAWLGGLANKPPPTSCRAGAVVHLHTVNGVKVPVTVNIQIVDNGDSSEFVVKIMKATEEQNLDNRRLLLQLDQNGVVLTASQNTPKSLYGFNPSDLIGKPLEAFVDVFGEWQAANGNTRSLLTMMGKQAEEHPGQSYRVGVKQPNAGQRKAATTGAEGAWSLLEAVQQKHKICPAVMQLALVAEPEDDDASLITNGGEAAVLSVQLWRADMIACTLETDRHMVVTKADDMAALVFGVAPRELAKMDLKKQVSMGPQFARAEDLLRGPNAKKAAIKGASSVGPLFGAAHAFGSRHGDGKALKLEFQAAARIAHSNADKALVRVRVLEPATGSMDAMKAIGQKKVPPPPAAAAAAAEAAAVRQATMERGHADVSSDGSDAEEEAKVGRDANGSKSVSRSRTRDWINEASRRTLNTTRQQPTLGQGIEGLPEEDGEGGATAFVAIKQGGGGKANGMPAKRYDSGPLSEAAESESESEAEIEAEAAAGEASSDKDEDELVCDWRRAKRLKKLTNMLSSPAARSASRRWTVWTWAIISLMWGAHVIGLAVITNQVDSRASMMTNIANLSATTDKALMIVVRCILVARCHVPLFAKAPSCTPANYALHKSFADSLSTAVGKAHTEIYLGPAGTTPTPFPDQRLYDRWTYKQVPEITLKSNSDSGLQFANGTSTLWEMGNKYVSATKEVVFYANILNASTVNSSAFQYVVKNGDNSLYEGYTWSLDVYTSFIWDRLSALKVVLIVLLALELGLVQAVCVAYEYTMLGMCNIQRLRCYGVFLALPSATIRAMASRPCQVDDEEVEEVDEDEAAMQAEGDAQPTNQPQGKSVKMQAFSGQGAPSERRSVDGRPPARFGGHAAQGSRASQGGKKRNASGAHGASLFSSLQHLMSGWLQQTKFKINGKRMLPDRNIVYKFMLPLLCYMVLVAAIYGVSLMKVAAVESPLVALNGLAHVTYRVSRTRLKASQLAYAADDSNNDALRAALREENNLLRQEYNTLMYGGPMLMQADVNFDAKAPPAAFITQAITDLFFRTNQCLRTDGSACYNSTHPFHAITHHGLDALMMRHLAEMDTLADAPDNATLPSNPGIVYLLQVTSLDMVPGLYTGLDLFVKNVIADLQAVKMLHIILMVIITLGFSAYWFGLFLPHAAQLRTEGKVIAGLLSQLPAETDVEGFVKSVVLQIRREDGNATRNSMRAGGSSVRADSHTMQRPQGGDRDAALAVVVAPGYDDTE